MPGSRTAVAPRRPYHLRTVAPRRRRTTLNLRSHSPVDRPPVLLGHAWREVPWRTIAATIGCVLATLVAVLLLRQATRILTWLAVAVFFAVVLGPVVDWLEQRAHLRRGLAVAIAVVGTILVLLGTMALFIVPVVRQAPSAISDLPDTVAAAGRGRGPLGHLVTQFHLESFVQQNAPRLQQNLDKLGASSVKMLREVFSTLVAILTIIVLTALLLLQGPQIVQAIDEQIVPARHQSRVRQVAQDSAKAISGYMFGNLVISVIAGVATFVALEVLRVPHAALLAAWVAFADLIPLVGATLGAAPAVLIAFLHSPFAGFATLAFFILYQQIENHALQTTIMAKTVKVSPLVVLLSVLAGVELFGFLGALLAVPVAGVLQVVVKAWWELRREARKLKVPG